MIREYEERDLVAIKRMHERSGLPIACLPDLSDPLFCVKVLAERRGRITHAGFVKLIGEAFVLVDHEVGTPQDRLDGLEHLVAAGLSQAADKGLDAVSAWLPPEVEPSFGVRLVDMGWLKSPWQSYSAILG